MATGAYLIPPPFAYQQPILELGGAWTRNQVSRSRTRRLRREVSELLMLGEMPAATTVSKRWHRPLLRAKAMPCL